MDFTREDDRRDAPTFRRRLGWAWAPRGWRAILRSRIDDNGNPVGNPRIYKGSDIQDDVKLNKIGHQTTTGR